MPSGPMLSRPLITPESLYRDRSLLMPAVGDKTSTGLTLTGIGGHRSRSMWQRMVDPGTCRGQHSKSISRSGIPEQGKLTRMGNKAQQVSKGGVLVDLVYTAMSGTSGDYSTMMSDALAAQLPGAPITRNTAKDFDADMRGEIPAWPGVKSPKLTRSCMRTQRRE